MGRCADGALRLSGAALMGRFAYRARCSWGGRGENERAEMRPRIREGGAERVGEHVARLLGIHDRVDVAAGGGVAGIELMLVVRAHLVHGALSVGVERT